MPELPEVETIARSLRNAAEFQFNSNPSINDRPGVIGRRIENIEVIWARSIATPDVDAFVSRIRGQVIREVGRRGKFLVFELDPDWLLIHLRMSGDIRVEPQQDFAILTHDRVVFNFKDGTRMVFSDPRKFGRAWLVDDPQAVLGKLGPEPLSQDLTANKFYAELQRHKTRIKALLLDQHFIAGLGNIYSDEALHLSKIHPLQKADSISPERAQLLLGAIQAVLQEGIQRNGASIDWVYRGGDFQNHFRVYQRTGDTCPVCGTKIERIVLGQRGTHYCPNCQVLT